MTRHSPIVQGSKPEPLCAAINEGWLRPKSRLGSAFWPERSSNVQIRAGGMAKLHIDLLGGCSAGLDGDGPCFLPTRKSQALLAYLAVPAGRFHAREKLTAMFWGDTPEAQARQSFRQALLSIRRAVGSGPHPILLARNGAVALDAEAVTVDVALLEAALADGTTEGLEQAAALYKGEFLAGLNLNEQAFEEWRSLRARAAQCACRRGLDQFGRSAGTRDA